MARVKIQLADNIKRVVFIDPAATEGADIGTNLRYNGVVQTLPQLQALFGGSGSRGVTAHRLLSGLAIGNDHPQYVRKDTLEARGDLYVRDASTVIRKALGAAKTTLRSDGTDPQWQAPAALTKTDDTNVTITLGGAPATALLEAASITLGWTGQLAATRGGTSFGSYAVGDMIYASGASALAKLTIGTAGYVLKSTAGIPSWTAPAALTKTDDTNVTLTLGGSAATSLLNAASITVGWTGTLAATRGGTSFGTYTTGDLLYASATNTLSKRAIGATNDVLTVIGGVPTWAAPAAGGGLANPTGTIGLTAVNGVATTGIRSDGAPALSQAIAPTWTGAHNFTGAAVATATPSGVSVGNLNTGPNQYPTLRLVASAAPTDAKVWRHYVDEGVGTYVLQTINDANSGASVKNALTITRTATAVGQMDYGNSTDNPFHAMYGRVRTSVATNAGAGSAQQLAIIAPEYPGIGLGNTNGATNEKNWDIYTNSTNGQFYIRAVNDANNAASEAFVAKRVAMAITAISIGNSTDNPTVATYGRHVVTAPFTGGAANLSVQNTQSTTNAVVLIGATNNTDADLNIYISGVGKADKFALMVPSVPIDFRLGTNGVESARYPSGGGYWVTSQAQFLISRNGMILDYVSSVTPNYGRVAPYNSSNVMQKMQIAGNPVEIEVAGTAIVQFNGAPVTTGLNTYFPGGNKPGIPGGTPYAWIPVQVLGQQCYFPVWR